jgi:hypothetical protein
MNFNPCNRHLLLKRPSVASEEKKSTVLVPESFKVNLKPYEIYEVVDVAKDCEKISSSHVNKQVVVNNNMIEKIDVEGQEILLVLENHVYGVIEK